MRTCSLLMISRGVPGGEDLALENDVRPVADFQSPLDIVVGDQHGDVMFLAQAADFDLEFLDGHGGPRR